ncbi:uncharacterized protein FA14DRAFT_78319 [Meira miltonrushii]|uniref:Uncharacterized protein n=1 Tax=Meira miltonrushii TaxID=1280837 RepID=A0A316V5G8_9BASI|nr:uncharacterized protein FA14DRAFT_78319 [Meira miltonrushii]PWN32819.1 hypothetical protein FA14DRAFT_78319 [Meira miltonrushii]
MKVEINKKMERRQTQAQEDCFVDYAQLSCYPTADTRVLQDQWGKFIWNRNFPEFTNRGDRVDIYLFNADSDAQVQQWLDIPNEQGRIAFSPIDEWWKNRVAADSYNGTHIPWPYYFIVTYANKGLDGPLTRQPTFHAIQTALPASISALRSSSSAAAAASSSASAASASSLSASHAPTSTLNASSSNYPSPTPVPSSDLPLASSFAASLTSALVSSLSAINATGTQSLQTVATTTFPDGATFTASATAVANGQLNELGESHGIPAYAIALIVVFGFLSLLGMLIGIYFCIRATRRHDDQHGDRVVTDKDSGAGSNTPLFGNTSNDQQLFSHDIGESPLRRAHRRVSDASVEHRHQEALTATEVWRLANAFRSALRRPRHGTHTRTNSLAGIREIPSNGSGSHPTSSGGDGPIMSPELDAGADRSLEDAFDPAESLLREELAREGKSIRLVQDRKKPELHGEYNH